jgi:hypothetical protein
MGACDFKTVQTGDSARHAFVMACDHAAYMSGHGGYTGTIAEKSSFIEIRDTLADVRRLLANPAINENTRKYCVKTLDRAAESSELAVHAHAVADVLMCIDDSRIRDKWGPAGCINAGPKTYLFFGYASS